MKNRFVPDNKTHWRCSCEHDMLKNMSHCQICGKESPAFAAADLAEYESANSAVYTAVVQNLMALAGVLRAAGGAARP
jgi:hypothetical protein